MPDSTGALEFSQSMITRQRHYQGITNWSERSGGLQFRACMKLPLSVSLFRVLSVCLTLCDAIAKKPSESFQKLFGFVGLKCNLSVCAEIAWSPKNYNFARGFSRPEVVVLSSGFYFKNSAPASSWLKQQKCGSEVWAESAAPAVVEKRNRDHTKKKPIVSLWSSGSSNSSNMVIFDLTALVS